MALSVNVVVNCQMLFSRLYRGPILNRAKESLPCGALKVLTSDLPGVWFCYHGVGCFSFGGKNLVVACYHYLYDFSWCYSKLTFAMQLFSSGTVLSLKIQLGIWSFEHGDTVFRVLLWKKVCFLTEFDGCKFLVSLPYTHTHIVVHISLNYSALFTQVLSHFSTLPVNFSRNQTVYTLWVSVSLVLYWLLLYVACFHHKQAALEISWNWQFYG
jgi:hypothetical protein